jgi:hypothetical protein
LARTTSERERLEKRMTESSEAYVADLHIKAAYAHTAAAYSHSTGDHASAQELARTALGDSLEAARQTEAFAKKQPQSAAA